MPNETPYPVDQLPIDFTVLPHNHPPQESFPLTIKAKGRQIKKLALPRSPKSSKPLVATCLKANRAASYWAWSRNLACIVGITNE